MGAWVNDQYNHEWLHSYLQSNIVTFNSTGSTAMKTVQALKEMNPQGVGKSINAAPVISRRSYNGKKVVMSSAAEISKIRTYFAALKNSRTTTTENPQDLVNSLSLSPIGDSYVTDLNRYYDVNIYTFGGLVLNVKGYDGEVFVNLGGKGNSIE